MKKIIIPFFLLIILCSCKSYPKKNESKYEWEKVKSILWKMEFIKARNSLIKEKDYPDYTIETDSSITIQPSPKTQIENKYETGFNDGWKFMFSPQVIWSSSGYILKTQEAELEKIKKDKDKNKSEYARGFIDAINEYKRINAEAARKADYFIASFKKKYKKSFPYKSEKQWDIKASSH